MKLKLRSKLLISIVGIILFFGFIATYAVYLYSYQFMNGHFIDDEEVLLGEQVKAVEELFDFSSDLVVTLSERTCLSDCLQGIDSGFSYDEVVDVLEGYNVSDSFSAIYVMDVEGEVQFSTQESFFGQNYGFRKYFQNSLKGETYLDVALGVTSGAIGYYNSAPVFDDEGGVIGVVVAKMRPEVVSSILNFDAVEEGVLMFVDEYGVILGSNDERRVYNTLAELDEKEIEEISELRRYEGLDFTALSYDVVLDSLSDIVEPESFQLFDDLEGEEEIVTVAKVGEYPLYLVFEQGLEEVESVAFGAAKVLSVFVVFAALSASFVIILILLKFLRPIGKINSFAKKLSAGDYSQKILIDSGDEIQELAVALNEMAENIAKSHEEVEKKVSERTEELEKMMKFMEDREIQMIELKKNMKNNQNNENHED